MKLEIHKTIHKLCLGILEDIEEKFIQNKSHLDYIYSQERLPVIEQFPATPKSWYVNKINENNKIVKSLKKQYDKYLKKLTEDAN